MHIPQLQYFYTALPDGLAGCDGKDMEEGGTTCSLFFKTQTVTLSLKEYWFSFLFALSFLSFILRNRSKIDLVQSSHSNPSEGCKCPNPTPWLCDWYSDAGLLSFFDSNLQRSRRYPSLLVSTTLWCAWGFNSKLDKPAHIINRLNIWICFWFRFFVKLNKYINKLWDDNSCPALGTLHSLQNTQFTHFQLQQ